MAFFDLRMLIIIVSLSVAVLGIVILLAILIRKKRTEKKELDYFKGQLHKIIRNEALDKALDNYSKSSKQEYWLLKAVEINQFGEKEHFYNLDKNVSIGREFNTNELFVLDENADLNQCRIELYKHAPYIKSVSGSTESSFFFKKKNGRNIEKVHTMKKGELIRIYSGDAVKFGETTIVFHVYNSNYGIV